MRIVPTAICALALAGCATDLPYTIAIGNPSEDEIGPGYKECVLRLNDIVKEVADNYSPSKLNDIKSLQVKFEMQLRHGTQTEYGTLSKERLHEREVTRPLKEPPPLENCKDGKQDHKKGNYPPIEEVAKKWLTSYALDAADPDQGLDRFREYVRSAQLVQHLANQPLLPDVERGRNSRLVEETSPDQSQWCGGLTPPLVSSPAQSSTSQASQVQAQAGEVAKNAKDCRSLYHVQAVLTAPAGKGETADDLYTHLLADIVQVEKNGTQRNQRYFMLGYEIPWDKDRTLVRYGVTFYFRQTAPENGEPASESTPPVQLIGYDLIYANEATPQPFEPGTDRPPKLSKEGPWHEYPWRITGYPFSLVIGLKNAAFELAKLPFSTIAGLLFGRDAYNYPLENLLTAYDALYVEATTQTHRGAEEGLYRLLTEIPLVGQLFQYNSGGDRTEPDKLLDDRSTLDPSWKKIFLSRGIYGGNKWGQDTGLWALFARQSYPTYDIYSPPYRHGTVIDVVWSMFNLSHGPAYSEAKYVMDQASREDRLYLAGHSGGVQRSAAASRILFHHGYKVVKVVGIAGPSVGQAIVDPRYPEAFKVYLNTGSGANQDVVSKVGNVAGAFSTLLNYAVIVPLKYTLGTLGGLVIWDREGAYRVADRFGFSNASIVEVERKPSSRHQTPMRISFTDRLVFDAYIRNEFSIAFREDLERMDRPHETDRPHAFPWEP